MPVTRIQSNAGSLTDHEVASASGTSLVLGRTPNNIFQGKAIRCLVGMNLTTCENVVGTLNGRTVTLGAPLANAHSAGEAVLIFYGRFGVHTGFFGIGSTGDQHATWQRMLRDIGPLGYWIEGGGPPISKPSYIFTGGRVRDMLLQTHTTYGPDDANGGLLQYHLRAYVTYTATQVGSLFTVGPAGVSGWQADLDSAAASGTPGLVALAFDGDVPAPLVGGTWYFLRDLDSTAGTFRVSATPNGAAITLNAGSTGGFVYPNINAMCRGYIRRVSFLGNSRVQNLLVLHGQQDSVLEDLTFDSMTKYGALLDGQIGYANRVRFVHKVNGSIGMRLKGHGIDILMANATRASPANAGCTAFHIFGYDGSITNLWPEYMEDGGIVMEPGAYGWEFISVNESGHDKTIVIKPGPKTTGYRASFNRTGASDHIVVDDQARGIQVLARTWPLQAVGRVTQTPDASPPKILDTRGPRAVSASTDVLVLQDTNSKVIYTAAGTSAQTVAVTIPTQAAEPFVPETETELVADTDRIVTLVPGSWTLKLPPGKTATARGRGSTIVIVHESATTKRLKGDLGP